MDARADKLINAMTVDVEDYFHVKAFADVIDPGDWDGMPCRIERNVERILELFDGFQISATFFVLGWIAERYPDLVRTMAEAGHEIASHGWDHVPVDQQSPEDFRGDCLRTRLYLEDIASVPVIGFRAPSFSINQQTPWAHKILKDAGYQYSSSVYPVHHDLYGAPGAPRFSFFPVGSEGVIELPMSTVSLLGHNFPCAGGGYFRLLPLSVSRWAIRRVNQVDQQPSIFFFHPWEIDPQQPHQHRATMKSRFRHYLNLSKTEGRLRKLLVASSWSRMDNIFQAVIAQGATFEERSPTYIDSTANERPKTPLGQLR
jgi:polysaccharide deacetylase family protein (PEP-CTERM system associated)